MQLCIRIMPRFSISDIEHIDKNCPRDLVYFSFTLTREEELLYKYTKLSEISIRYDGVEFVYIYYQHKYYEKQKNGKYVHTSPDDQRYVYTLPTKLSSELEKLSLPIFLNKWQIDKN